MLNEDNECEDNECEDNEENNSSSNESDNSDMETEERPPVRRTYIPNNSNTDEELVCDESVYELFQKAETGYPCLSFSIIEEHCSGRYPLTISLVCGTQSDKHDKNSLQVIKLSNINKNKVKKERKDEEDDDELSSDDSDDEDSKPELECASISHSGCVNRVRVTQINGKPIAASWSESQKVFIWDLSVCLEAVNDVETMTHYTRNNLEKQKPLFTFNGHHNEGYAIDWSGIKPGMLASGDCTKNVFIWKPSESGTWLVDQRHLKGHNDSVEDLQWSPIEENVLASCSVDKSIKIWDIRTRSCMLTVDNAHDSDVNVISWNKHEKTFIISGGDDGVIKTWDLRLFKSKSVKPKPIATFKHHSSYITSIEWHPTDSTVFAASGNDNQLTLWDLAVEKDIEKADETELNELPPQLLFIHQGQKEIKEIHWHEKMPGVILSTALNGFDIFKTISV